MSDDGQNDVDVTFSPEDIPDAEWYREPIPRPHAALVWTFAIGVTIATYLYGPAGLWVVMAGLLFVGLFVVATAVVAPGCQR